MMHVANCLESLENFFKNTPLKLAIGNFDGVHLGHQELIRGLKQRAEGAGHKSMVVSFVPHPMQFFAKNSGFQKIDTPSMRRRRLQQLGLDALLELPFDHQMASLAPEDFLRCFFEPLNISEISVGHDFRFGKNRLGGIDLLVAHGKSHNYEVKFIEQVMSDDEVVSSSLIRECIARDGHIAKANRLLGREFEIEGRVTKGDQIGRTIGFPTANIQAGDQIIPKSGVYSGYLRIITDISRELREVERLPCVVNIGQRPTLKLDAPTLRIEAHVLDRQLDLYGELVCLEFIDRVRDEINFANLDQLKERIRADIIVAKSHFK